MILFYFLVILMPLDQDPTWGRFVGAATLIKYLGLLCVFYAILHVATQRTSLHYLKTIQARLFMCYLMITFISYWFMGPQFSIRTSPFISFLSMFFLFFIVLSVVDTIPRLRWTLLAAVASMGWASLVVTREWMRDPMWRPGSIAGDANYFALDACLILPLAFLFVLRSRITWERIFALGCLVATIGSTMLGGSRGGFLAIGTAFLWILWHSPHRLRNFVFLIVLIVPPLLFTPFSPVRRLLHPQYSDVTGENDRVIAWRAGLRMIEAHPLLGIGLGEFKPQMQKYADPGVGFSSIAHNTYLEVASETGLPNFLVFVAMLLFTYRNLGRVRRQASDSGPPTVYLAATALQASLAGYLVGAFFLSSEYMKLFWLWIFLSLLLPSFLSVQSDVRRSGSSRPATSSETQSEPTIVNAF